jgi:hypothetical protein
MFTKINLFLAQGHDSGSEKRDEFKREKIRGIIGCFAFFSLTWDFDLKKVMIYWGLAANHSLPFRV